MIKGILKNITCYLPYDLKFQSGNMIETITGIDYNQELLHFGDGEYDWFNLIGSPILRPISDLSKPLDDGTIPIIELAKIAFPNHTWELWNKIAVNKNEIGFIENKFSYIQSEDYFMHTFKEGAVKNISKLYNYLNQHHFDYQGLIDNELAIDINTI